ncbi:hypothetical protein [Terrabacter sp. Root181]|nr:hypothetical protein [Terrabacter sp. Root181]
MREPPGRGVPDLEPVSTGFAAQEDVEGRRRGRSPREVTVELPTGYGDKPYTDAMTGRAVQPVKGKLT